MLCDLCREFALSVVRQDFSEKWVWKYNDSLHRSFATYKHGTHEMLEQSARAGCRFCCFFLLEYCRNRWLGSQSSADEDRIRFTNDTGEENIDQHEDGTVSRGCFKFRVVPSLRFWGSGSFDLCIPEDTVYTELERPDRNVLPRRFLPALTSSVTIDTIHHWRALCRKRHAECRRKEDTEMPTRVIDVGSGGTFQDVHLAETKGQKGEYLTLSYCWGLQHPYKTTTENIHANKSRIEFDQLPRTIKDAIKFTRLLGFQYIWIDALCIIQNDLEDWKRECARMCSIYEGTTLSLSALDAQDCEEGFLHDRLFAEQLEFDAISLKIGIFRRTSSPNWCVSPSKLESRAWVLQERVLAPAVLHFASGVVLWECCGDINWFGHEYHFQPSHLDMEGQSFYIAKKTLRAANPATGVRFWYTLAENYSKRVLSRSSDRLVAIQGLAERFQRSRSDKYVLGHWSDCFFFDLLWNPSEDLQIAFEPVERPSWSWLTAGVPIKHRLGIHSDLKSQLLTEPSAKDWVSQARIEIIENQMQSLLSSSILFLRVHGRFKGGSLNSEWQTGLEFWASQDGHIEHHQKPIPALLDAFGSSHRVWPRHLRHHRYHWYFEQGHFSSLNVYCLLLAHEPRDIFRQKRDHYLLLERIDTGDPDWRRWIIRQSGGVEDNAPYFRRIGTGSRQYQDDGEDRQNLHSDWQYGELIIV